MWFKNIHACQATVAYEPDKLAEALFAQPFKPCSAVMPVSAGFVPCVGDEDAPLVHAEQGYMMFCLQVQGKILPPAVLREQHQLKILDLERKLGKRLARDEKARLKDEIEYTLLTQAFHKTWKIYAYFDTHAQQLVVDTSSKKNLALFYKLCTPLLTDYNITHYALKSPSLILTNWLAHGAYPGSFCILDKATLEDTQEQKGRVSFARKDLFGNSVKNLLEEGALVTRLGLNWGDKIHFTLKDDFSISGLRFLDIVKDLAKDGIAETVEQQFAADFFIMAKTISGFFSRCVARVCGARCKGIRNCIALYLKLKFKSVVVVSEQKLRLICTKTVKNGALIL